MRTQSKKQTTYLKRGKTRVTKLRLVLVLHWLVKMAARDFWTNHWVKQSKTKAIQDHFRYLIENFSCYGSRCQVCASYGVFKGIIENLWNTTVNILCTFHQSFFSLLSPYKSQNIITLVLNLLSAHYDDYVMTLNGVCIKLKQCCYICHNSLDTDRRSNMCKSM